MALSCPMLKNQLLVMGLVSCLALSACNLESSPGGAGLPSTQFSEFEGYWVSETDADTGMGNLMQVSGSGDITVLFTKPKHREEMLPKRLYRQDGKTFMAWAFPGSTEELKDFKATVRIDESGKFATELELGGQLLPGQGFTRLSKQEADQTLSEFRAAEIENINSKPRLLVSLVGSWNLTDVTTTIDGQVTERKLPHELPNSTESWGELNGQRRDFKVYTPKKLSISAEGRCVVNGGQIEGPVTIYNRRQLALVLDDFHAGTGELSRKDFRVRFEGASKMCLSAYERTEYCYARAN
jgi:hypothetical protein